jgi:hypothetical protein
VVEYFSSYLHNPLKAVGKVAREPAEGVTLSGIQTDKTDHKGDSLSELPSGNSGEARKGAEGARRKPNLSGKRTEIKTLLTDFLRWWAYLLYNLRSGQD